MYEKKSLNDLNRGERLWSPVGMFIFVNYIVAACYRDMRYATFPQALKQNEPRFRK